MLMITKILILVKVLHKIYQTMNKEAISVKKSAPRHYLYKLLCASDFSTQALVALCWISVIDSLLLHDVLVMWSIEVFETGNNSVVCFLHNLTFQVCSFLCSCSVQHFLLPIVSALSVHIVMRMVQVHGLLSRDVHAQRQKFLCWHGNVWFHYHDAQKFNDNYEQWILRKGEAARLTWRYFSGIRLDVLRKMRLNS